MEDVEFIHHILTGTTPTDVFPSLAGVRIGLPWTFYENLELEVAKVLKDESVSSCLLDYCPATHALP